MLVFQPVLDRDRRLAIYPFGRIEMSLFLTNEILNLNCIPASHGTPASPTAQAEILESCPPPKIGRSGRKSNGHGGEQRGDSS
jgi:hypothetical protein